MIRAEFLRFIDALDHTSVTDDEWRLLNIINENLESIVPLGTAAGRRSKFIVGVAFPEFESFSDQAPETAQQAPRTGNALRRLDVLRVGPFRGFAKETEFDLSSQVVLLYGPNGTGKSSFCEALELALLGSVNDCTAKRIDANQYLKNARTGTFEHPKLKALFESGELEEVVGNNDLFRFCFVEKNRIDDFSRIASFTPNQQERLIASLFGIQEFNSFVENFNESINNYLPDDSTAAIELRELELALAGDRQTVNTKAATLEALADEEDFLAITFQEGMDFAAFVQAVGNAESGRIKELTDQISQPRRAKIGAIQVGIADAVSSARSSWTARAALQESRLARASELSYRDLYASLLALESSSLESCPACDTPLFGDRSAVSNPYLKAKIGLQGLTELAEIERRIEGSTRQLETRANGLLTQLANLEENLDERERQSSFSTNLRIAIAAGRTDITSGWWQGLFGLDDETPSECSGFLYSCVERMERLDELISRQEEEREAARRELIRLDGFREKIVERSTQRASAERRIREAEAALHNAENAILTAQRKVEAEASKNAVRQRIVNAYMRLMSRLQEYREALPATLLADLGQSVVALYNSFNRRDCEGDLMADIKLPFKSGDRITFSYASAPQKYFDALHVLSEGHIRCLGLAVLLAKNLETNCPVLIFDDPVNAIDDDHREGIRRTLFEDPYFASKQIVLTCHGEEFTKDIQNLIGIADAASKCKSYTFLSHSGDNHIRTEVMATKNHILSARNKLDRNEFRESLTDARRGLEWVANTIWTKILPAAGVKGLSVQLARPGSRPELMNLVQSLIKEMGKASFVSAQKAQLIAGMNRIIGLNQSGREWEYLNKGTHEEEDRTEFDQGIVKTVVQALEDLDAAITASRRPLPQSATITASSAAS